MAEQQTAGDQIQFLLSDFNTRLRDIEERNRLVKERVLLLGQNLISIKTSADDEISNLKKQTNQMKRELTKLKSLVNSVVTETNKFVKKDEMIVIERMLKDFQPLDFARMKDVEAIVKKILTKQNSKPIPKTSSKNQ